MANDKERIRFLMRYFVPFKKSNDFPVNNTSNFSEGNIFLDYLLIIFLSP